MKKELVIVVDFGGQYNQLVGRRGRECNVYCEIYLSKTDTEQIKLLKRNRIICTGRRKIGYKGDGPTYSKE